jgi:hypothetical protein
MSLSAHEQAFIGAFVQAPLRERWVFMLSNAKRRQRHLCRLYHGFEVEAKVVEQHKHLATKQAFVSMLLSRGAGGDVYAISTNPHWDAKTFSFSEATHDDGCAWLPATICIYKPKHLAVFCDEYDRYVLFNGA